MTDFFINKIPLPVPRPQIDDIPVDPRIFTDKPVTESPDVFSTPTFKDKIMELWNQFYGNLPDGWTSDSDRWFEVFVFMLALSTIVIVGMVVWTGISMFVRWLVGND